MAIVLEALKLFSDCILHVKFKMKLKKSQCLCALPKNDSFNIGRGKHIELDDGTTKLEQVQERVTYAFASNGVSTIKLLMKCLIVESLEIFCESNGTIRREH